jgi:hypothetical protein
MARRPALDLGFAAAVLACCMAAVVAGPPSIPDGVCSTTGGEPRFVQLLADERITIAELDDPRHRAWSRDALIRALRARGFREVTADRFERGVFVVDIMLVTSVRHELADALATHDVVYYNGHSERGEIPIVVPDEHRIIFLDSCWTTQLYSERLVGNHEVISNTERSITGSIQSLVILIDGLEARSPWDSIVARLNERAERRATGRGLFSIYRSSERYRRDVACRR